MGIFSWRIFYIIWRVEQRNVIGARVRQARKGAKPPITQSDLVARLQVLGIVIDQSSLSKIETQRRPVSDVEVIAFSKALKVPVSWLLGETDSHSI